MIRCVSSSCAFSFLPSKGQVDLSLRRLLGLFDEAMQQHHAFVFHAEENAGDAATPQAAADFPQLAANRANEGHADRPRELNLLNVLADDLPVFGIQTPEPLSNGLPSAV